MAARKRLVMINDIALDIAKRLRKAHNTPKAKDVIFSPSEWVQTEYCAIYLRHKFWNPLAAQRSWTRGYVLASINVYEAHKSKGLFTALLRALGNFAEPIYIENVLDRRFHHFLHRQGFVVLPRDHNQLSLDIPCLLRFPDAPLNPSPLFQVEDRWYYWTHDHRINGPFATKEAAVRAHDIEEYNAA